MRHLIGVYTFCRGLNIIQGLEYAIFQTFRPVILKLYNGQSYPYCIYLYEEIHQKTKDKLASKLYCSYEGTAYVMTKMCGFQQ